MYPQGDDGGGTPQHAFYAQSKYFDGFGSGSNATNRGNLGKFNIIEANQWTHIAYTWNNQNSPALYINGKQYLNTTSIPAEYLPGDEPESINFLCDLKGYITHLRVSEDVYTLTILTPLRVLLHMDLPLVQHYFTYLYHKVMIFLIKHQEVK